MDCKEFNLKIPFSDQFGIIEKHLEHVESLHGKKILRFTSTKSDDSYFDANILFSDHNSSSQSSIFSFQKRDIHIHNKFNVCFLIPTGIGCEIGGHSGDGTPALKLIASSCDKVITHPNVVNASDINEIPENATYVEGSHITQLLMGNIGLSEVKSNKVLVIIANDDQANQDNFVDSAINSVNGARATIGLDAEIILLQNPMKMRGEIQNNRAIGEISNLDALYNVLLNKKGSYDAVAITSKINVPKELHEQYSESNGDMPNPWGSVESMLTHFITSEFQIPSAHAPMFENNEIAEMNFGVVDPRIAPEVVSTTFFHCVLKGLQKAPAITSNASLFNQSYIFSAKDISALVIPDGVLGLPILSALHQGIKVIAVKNKNSMNNDLTQLSWKKDQFIKCDSYIEASGILNCLKAGISVESVKRPLKTLLKDKDISNHKNIHSV